MKLFEAIFKLVGCLFCFVIGMGVFGWGLVALAYVPREPHLTVGTIALSLMMAFMCFAFCLASFLLFCSTFADKKTISSMKLALIDLYFLGAALFAAMESFFAMSEGRMERSYGNKVLAIFLCLCLVAFPIVHIIQSYRMKKISTPPEPTNDHQRDFSRIDE